MNTIRSMQLTGILGLLLLAAAPAMANMDGGTPSAEDNNMVIYLGNVEVRGQEKITRTLQAIKVALTMPYSNDPKLANVMVCRLEDKAGSHVQQELICGSNRILAGQRAALQSTFTVAAAQNSGPGSTSCTTGTCYQAVFDALNETMESMPGHYLHTTVNGTAFRGLLQQIPMPKYEMPVPQASPQATTAPAVPRTL